MTTEESDNTQKSLRGAQRCGNPDFKLKIKNEKLKIIF
jgi:hypothetical protein